MADVKIDDLSLSPRVANIFKRIGVEDTAQLRKEWSREKLLTYAPGFGRTALTELTEALDNAGIEGPVNDHGNRVVFRCPSCGELIHRSDVRHGYW